MSVRVPRAAALHLPVQGVELPRAALQLLPGRGLRACGAAERVGGGVERRTSGADDVRQRAGEGGRSVRRVCPEVPMCVGGEGGNDFDVPPLPGAGDEAPIGAAS